MRNWHGISLVLFLLIFLRVSTEAGESSSSKNEQKLSQRLIKVTKGMLAQRKTYPWLLISPSFSKKDEILAFHDRQKGSMNLGVLDCEISPEPEFVPLCSKILEASPDSEFVLGLTTASIFFVKPSDLLGSCRGSESDRKKAETCLRISSNLEVGFKTLSSLQRKSQMSSVEFVESLWEKLLDPDLIERHYRLLFAFPFILLFSFAVSYWAIFKSVNPFKEKEN